MKFLGYLVASAFLCSVGVVAYEARDSQWTEYVDADSGLRISYPAHVFPVEWHTPWAAAVFNADARLEVVARPAESLETLKQELERKRGGNDKLHTLEGDGMLVAWGVVGTHIVYARYELVGGQVQGFSVSYPARDHAYYRPIVETIEASFEPARRFDVQLAQGGRPSGRGIN